MSAAGFSFDTREFTAALRLYESATLKDEVEIVNRASRNVILRAMSFTPKATAAKIRSDLRALGPQRYFRLVNAVRKRKGLPPVAGKEMAEAGKAFLGKRAASAAYIRAGWIPAAKDMGAAVRGRVSSKGKAAAGSATKASRMRRVSEIVNTATGSALVGTDALEKAVNFVARDMRQHAERKLSQTAKRFSVT